MSTKKQLTIAWGICAVLAIALIAALVVIMNQKKDLGAVLDQGHENITEQRDRIATYCGSDDPAQQNRCQDELIRMTTLLREFSRDIERANPPATSSSIATTTVTIPVTQ